MNVKKCDQCEAVMGTGRGFHVQNNMRLSAAGISDIGEPNVLDLCSWRCMEEYARERAA